jgi:hypothetical protein
MARTATRKVEVSIVGDASSMVRAFRQGDKAASGFGRRGGKLGAVGMGMLAGAAAGVTVAVGQGLVSAFQTGVREFSEAQKVSAQTAAALKSTGGAAGVTQKHIEDMAGSLQKQTGLQDDAIQGAQNLLLTFTKISNAGPDKIFDRATQATMDLSVALGKDMGSSAIMVGKALNDPVRGVTALGRAGVQFTASQKETIKSLVDTGRVADAQKMILKELETQVGGSARAFGETTPGQIEKAKRAFEDMSQGVVTAVAPIAAAVLPGLTAAINGTVSFFQTNFPRIQAVAMTVWNWFSANLLPTFRSIGSSIGSIVVSIVGIFRTYWPQIMSVVGPIVRALGGTIKSAFGVIAGVLKLVASILRGDFSGAWQAIKGIASSAISGVASLVKNIPQALLSAAGALLKAALDLGKKVVEKIAEGIGSAPGLIKTGLSRLFGLAGDAGAVNPYLSQITGAGAKVPQAVAKGITGGKGKVSKGMSTMLGGAAGDAKGTAGSKGQPVGSALSSGIAQGVRDAGSSVGGAISSVIRQGIQQAKSENDIRSPSGRTARELGRPLADGTAQGIRQRGNQVRNALTGIVNAGMRSAVASAKNNAISLASSLASMFGQARTAGDTGRLGELERSLAADQSARQEDSLKRAKDEAIAEEAAKLAAKAGAEDAAQAERDYQDAVRNRLDAEAQLSDFYRQREIEDLRTDVQNRQTQYENDINNLAAQFGRGEISAEKFSEELDKLIGGERGAALGGAFALQFEMALKAVKDQLGALSGITGVQGVMPGSATPERPRETWERDVANVRQSLESEWEKKGESWKKTNKKQPWVQGKLNSWIRANKAKYGLATGGITQGPMPAIIGEAGREAVIPLEGPRARRMLRAGGIGGTVVNLTFNGVLDAKDAARMLRPELDRLVRLAV